MESHKGCPMLAFATAADWRDWLEANHAAHSAVWLKFAKKGSGVTLLSYEEARDTAICYGWIDGLINKLDETHYLTHFTSRTAKSGWSKVNREVAERAIASGAMHPSGLAHVEAAKNDGRWELAYDSPSKMEVSPDFQKALDGSPSAATFFEGLSKANRYSFLYRIQTAKTPEARARNIQKFVGMLEQGKCFHPDQ